MVNTKNITLTAGITLLTAVAAYLIVRKKQNETEYDNISTLISNIGQTGALGQNLQSTDTSSLQDVAPPWKSGDTSKSIAIMQKAINKNWNTNLDINGVLDENTENELCSHYFTYCNNSMPSFMRSTTVTQTDYDNILAGKTSGLL